MGSTTTEHVAPPLPPSHRHATSHAGSSCLTPPITVRRQGANVETLDVGTSSAALALPAALAVAVVTTVKGPRLPATSASKPKLSSR